MKIPFTKHTLANGLDVLIHEDHACPIVAVNIWYHVGSKNEAVGRTGFAHLFEHLMFNGSENYNQDYFKAVEQALADGWRYENLVLAYRWLAVEYGHMLIDISDAFGASEYQATGLLPRAVAKLKRTLRPDARQSRDLDRRPRPIRAGREITSLFECGAATVLDPRVERPLRPTSGRSEADVLGAEVALLVQAMYPRGNASASKLGRHLESLKDSRHAA